MLALVLSFAPAEAVSRLIEQILGPAPIRGRAAGALVERA
jgi:hypothetical protein